MNNRDERINFINKFNDRAKKFITENNILLSVDVEFNIVEEIFILECVKNDYVMKFIDNNIKNIDFFTDSKFISKYNYKYFVLNGCDKLDDINKVLFFLYNSEDNLDSVKSLCMKLNKKICKSIINGNVNSLELSALECCICLFMMSLLDKDIIKDSDLEDFNDSQCILYDCIASRRVSKRTAEKLREKYKDCLETLGLRKGITLKTIEANIEKKFLNYLTKYGDISNYEDVFKYREKESKRRLYLIEQDKHICKEEQILSISQHMICFGENSFRSYLQIEDHVINDSDIDYSLWLLDCLLERSAVITCKEFELVNILMARIVDFIMVHAISLVATKTLELSDIKYEFENKLVEAKNLNSNLIAANNQLNTRTLSLENENTKLKIELERARAEISRLKSKKNKEFNDKKELESLRELFFSMEREDLNYEYASDIDLSYNKNKRIAFVGSNCNLHNKLEPIFEKCKYIEANSVMRDLSFLKGMDIVFLHTHISHSMYYKVLETIKSSNTRLIFLNSTNVDILAKEMINFINK